VSGEPAASSDGGTGSAEAALARYWSSVWSLRHPIWQAAFELGVAAIAGLVVDRSFTRTAEVAAALSFLALTGLALLAGAWWAFALVNVAVLAAWSRAWFFWATKNDAAKADMRRGLERFLRVCVEFANRYLGHVDVLLTWGTFAIVGLERFGRQIIGVVLVFRFAPALVDILADVWAILRPPTATGDDAPEAEAIGEDLVNSETRHWRRRPIYYSLTLLGLMVLIGVAGVEQVRRVLPIVGVIGTATLIRFVLWSLRREKDGLTAEERTRFYDWARRIDWLVGAVVIGAALYLPVHALGPEAEAGIADHRARLERWNGCGAEASPGGTRALSLFIVSDSQFHELTGSRSGVHVDLVDSLVPVAVRPVELDLLSGVTLGRFAETYRTLRNQDATVQWAHLGDFGDLGCRSEMQRFKNRFLPRFGGPPAALAPGNHDSTFFGNFAWHPDWTSNCPGKVGQRLLTKSISDDLLREMQQEGGATVSSEKGFVAAVRSLGEIGGKAVVGVFVDTSDSGDFGEVSVAGVFGSFSEGQRRWLNLAVDSGANRDAYLVVFMHHPYESIRSRGAFNGFIEEHRARILGVVAAHTHLAAHRRIERFGLDEFVVGSTIDPPQEAALLEVIDVGGGAPRLSLTTLPAIERKDQTCVDGLGVKAATCASLHARLEKRGQCQALLGRCLPGRDASCAGLLDDGKHRKLVTDCWPSLHACRTENPAAPDEIKYLQSKRALRLNRCIREAGAELDPDPLAKGVPTEWLDQHAFDPRSSEVHESDPLPLEDLVCLSWAASILQSHKAQGWDFDQALRFMAESDATYGATRMITQKR
jgi:hypothetical protein